MGPEVLTIDGSYGEGGGQVLRTSLSLAGLLARPLQITNIRVKRKKPGLAAQHLTCVRAAAQVCQAEVSGDSVGSTILSFHPRRPEGGEYFFDVSEVYASAGSVGLVFQTVLPLLLFADKPSRVVLRGGTHVPWSPCFHYLSEVFLYTLRLLGPRVNLRLERAGWYPKGGGQVEAEITPVEELPPLSLELRGETELSGFSAVANLPDHIAERQRRAALSRLAEARYAATMEIASLQSHGQGTVCFLRCEGNSARGGFTALGALGKRAEKVGQECAEEALAFLGTDAAVDPHLADQLVLYMALSGGRSSVRTSAVTQHLLTNLWVVQQFLPVEFEVTGEEGAPGRVVVQGASISRAPRCAA